MNRNTVKIVLGFVFTLGLMTGGNVSVHAGPMRPHSLPGIDEGAIVTKARTYKETASLHRDEPVLYEEFKTPETLIQESGETYDALETPQAVIEDEPETEEAFETTESYLEVTLSAEPRNRFAMCGEGTEKRPCSKVFRSAAP